MASSPRPLLLVLPLLLGAAAVVAWLASREPASGDLGIAAPATPAAPADARRAADADPPRVELVGDATGVAPVADDTFTTVAWPVKIALELVFDGSLPSIEGVPQLGSGRNATLSGILVKPGGDPVAGSVRFVEGLNAGRELRCNAEGAFGASDLYPGLSIVEIDGPGIGGSSREVLLRAGKETLLNVSYDAPASMRGRVFDAATNLPLGEVEVELDGQRTATDAEGEFHFPAMTAGDRLLLILRKPGYASYREMLGVMRASQVPRDRYLFQLRRAAGLRITFSGAPSTDAAELVLMKSVAFGAYGELAGARTYPWHLVNPLELKPGQTVELADLPEGDVDVRAYLTGCVAVPPVSRVTVREGETRDLVLAFEAAPTLVGRVLDPEGRPVEGADVRLEAPDQTLALLNHVSQAAAFLEAEIWPSFPMCVQRARTGFDGAFRFTAWEKCAPTRYLVAESADGELRAIVAVRPSDTQLDVVLKPDSGARGRLAIEFPGRHQGLPVECTVGGVPYGEQVIPASRPLVVENLDEGVWRVLASWNGDPLFAAPPRIQVRGEAKLSIPLPPGAIDGQDAETLRRTASH